MSDMPIQTTKTNGLAITSLVLGILSIPLLFCYGFGVLLGIAALITGLIGRRQIQESAGLQTGNGMAIAGIVMGILTGVIGLCAGFVILILALMGPAIGNIFSNIVINI